MSNNAEEKLFHKHTDVEDYSDELTMGIINDWIRGNLECKIMEDGNAWFRLKPKEQTAEP